MRYTGLYWSLGLANEFEMILVRIIQTGLIFSLIFISFGILLVVGKRLHQKRESRIRKQLYLIFQKDLLAVLSGERNVSTLANYQTRREEMVWRDLMIRHCLNMKGQYLNKLGKCYKHLNLHKRDMRHLQRGAWWKKVKAAKNSGLLRIKETRPFLVSLLNHSNPEVVLACSLALGRMGFVDNAEEVVEKLKQLIYRHRTRSLEAVVSNGAKVVPHLRNLSITGNRFQRIWAIEALGRIRALDSEPELKFCSKSADEGIKITALNALTKLNNPFALESALKLTGSIDNKIVFQSIEILKKLGKSEARTEKRLAKLLFHFDWWVRYRAAQAMAFSSSGGWDALENLAHLQSGPAPDIAQTVIQENSVC